MAVIFRRINHATSMTTSTTATATATATTTTSLLPILLGVVLFHATLLVPPVHADVFVCGNSYSDASKNCTVNTPCPSGDSCPPDQATCYVVPDEKCFGPTIVPSGSPSYSPLLVCGYSYDDALTNCRSNTTTTSCLEGGICSNETHACFPIPYDLCPTYAPTYTPTVAPMVCGVDWKDAHANCLDLSMRCPSGDGCPTGKACFSVPTNVCGTTKQPTLSPTISFVPSTMMATTTTTTNVTTSLSPSISSSSSSSSSATNETMEDTTAPTQTISPTSSPIYNTYYCGETYELAENNCWTAEPCPSGSGCSNPNEECYGISTERCYTDPPTQTPTGPGPRPSMSPTISFTPTYAPSISLIPTSQSPSASPIVNSFFCGADYDDAFNKKCAAATSGGGGATPCPSGDGCPSGMACFGNIACTSSTSSSSSAPSASSGSVGEEPSFDNTTTTTSSSMPPYWEEIATTSPPSPTSIMSNNNSLPPSFSSSTTTTTTTNTKDPSTSMTQEDNTTTSTEVTMANPNNTFYCGKDYSDAYFNCATQPSCPSGAKEECADGQSCFLITTCSSSSTSSSATPSASTIASGSSSTTTSGGPTMTNAPSSVNSNTILSLAPTWDFSSFASGSSGSSSSGSDSRYDSSWIRRGGGGGGGMLGRMAMIMIMGGVVL